MCMVALTPLYCTLPEEPVTQPDISPAAAAPSPPFMMKTDTNGVIEFRDKLFTLPVRSAAIS